VSKRAMRIGAGIVAVFFLAVVWFALQVYPLGSPGRLVVVTVHSGDSVSTVAGELHAKGVIGSPLAFKIDMEVFSSLTLHAGSYQIAQNSSFAHVHAILNAPPNVLVIDVAPGETIHEVFDTVAADKSNLFADQLLGAAASLARDSPYHPDLTPPHIAGLSDAVNSLEGLVGVGQYLLKPDETAMSLARRMAEGFTKEATSVGFSPSTTVNGLSAYQLIIAASIVEREGYYPQNMPQVARVIFNRLKRGGGLQMDSTVKYPLGMDAGTVTPKMLQNPTPYNTYLHAGLTPTPICTVSTTALRAVLHAPPGSWLYFVLFDKKGDEKFATTFQQDLKYQQQAARNLG